MGRLFWLAFENGRGVAFIQMQTRLAFTFCCAFVRNLSGETGSKQPGTLLTNDTIEFWRPSSLPLAKQTCCT
jgi:hypothetical protein